MGPSEPAGKMKVLNATTSGEAVELTHPTGKLSAGLKKAHDLALDIACEKPGMKCTTCGKDIGNHAYSDHPTAITHSWAPKQCRECYIESGHPECVNEGCDTLLFSHWKYCSECGTRQDEKEKV